ncbi:ecdysteroid 22-kinase family protein [Nocardia vaccinii]|uniref:ecdysteroid 22-kinase family protein n=1 Tax=Nocardia vaccinii TaxID=1822 RepID=UPI000A8E85F6|nr:ecdysteroid 22-kinase family protein [Nocardia vaccinii]
MNTQVLATARGIASVAKEAVRAAADRTMPSGDGIPLRAGEATASWLAAALDLPTGSVTSLRILDQHSGTAGRARIAVDSAFPGAPTHLFLKTVPRNYLQHVLMNVFRLGTREILAYRALGDAPPLRVPRCYLARADRLRGRCVLLLEDLTGTAQFRTVVDSVTRAEAEAVVDALAGLHAHFWNTDRFTGDLRPLAQRTAAEIRIGDIVRRRFLGNIHGPAGDIIPERMKRQCRVFFERGGDIDAFWAAQPQTLLHGDPHLGNLFFESGTPGFLDWQVAAAGAGIRDIAYFATASVEPALLREIERDMVRRYVTRLAEADVNLDADHTWTLYRAAVTELFLAAVCTAEAGERMQPREVMRVGVQRAVAAVTAHDSFTLLDELIGPRRPPRR